MLRPTSKRLQLIAQPNGSLWVDFYFKLNVHASLEFQINCLSLNLIWVSHLIYISRSRALDLNSYILILIFVNNSAIYILWILSVARDLAFEHFRGISFLEDIIIIWELTIRCLNLLGPRIFIYLSRAWICFLLSYLSLLDLIIWR